MIATFLKAGKLRALVVASALIGIIAVCDWYAGNRFSLGLLYMLPMMLAATVLAPWKTFGLAIRVHVYQARKLPRKKRTAVAT